MRRTERKHKDENKRLDGWIGYEQGLGHTCPVGSFWQTSHLQQWVFSFSWGAWLWSSRLEKERKYKIKSWSLLGNIRCVVVVAATNKLHNLIWWQYWRDEGHVGKMWCHYLCRGSPGRRLPSGSTERKKQLSTSTLTHTSLSLQQHGAAERSYFPERVTFTDAVGAAFSQIRCRGGGFRK